MIFYDKVIKTIVDAVKEKTRETTNRLQNRILAIENTNLLFATKKEVEKRIGEVTEMISLDKISILKTVEEKVVSVASGLASMESVVSLAQGINNRLDNLYYALEVTKNQAVNQASEMVSGVISDLASTIASNTQEIAKNRGETLELKSVVDSLLPQIVQALDTTSLTEIIDSLVQVEMKAIEDRIKAEMEASNVDVAASIVENDPTAEAYSTPGVYVTEVNAFPTGNEEEEPLQG